MGQVIERREFLRKTFGLFIAANLPLADLAPFPWKREEVLFGPNAGFAEARLGQSIGIWADPQLYRLDLAEAIKPWNKAARQLNRNDLFHLEYDPEKIKVYFLPNSANSRTYVKAFPSYTDPYEYCIAYSQLDIPTYFAVHELGHTLGLVDFVTRNTDINAIPHVNPQKCYLPEKPIKSVMSACETDQRSWFGDDDKNLLRVAGYA